MTVSQKSLFWQQHIRAWQSSQLSQTAYCRTHALSLANFGYWRKRFTVTHRVPAIIPVVRESLAVGVQLRSPSGWVITLPTSIRVDALGAIMAALP